MSDARDPVPFLPADAFDIPVEDLVVGLVRHALDMPASDLFFTWNENDVCVSVRHLGTLCKVQHLSLDVGRRATTHLKAIAGMDVAQKRHPQDGRWLCAFDDEKVDLRINTIPTLYGEDMAVRLLRRNGVLLELHNLGLHAKDLGDLRSLVNSPSGLVLVTGPTGSGKTTTLYACLQYLNDGTRKINTIEDPVEYALDGIRQSGVNPRINLDFPELLRSVLRQAADVIMVGEIRDPVTAETAVRAANSGLLVFATLHAPTAAGAIASMLALGVHRFFLGTCLLGILTQRLVRTLCPKCRVEFDISESPHTFDDVQRWLGPDEGSKIYSAPGCDHCHREGYTGQTGVFEVLRVSRELRQMIIEGRPVAEIRKKAVADGMLDLRRSALLKVAQGISSTEELMRVIPAEHLMPEN